MVHLPTTRGVIGSTLHTGIISSLMSSVPEAGESRTLYGSWVEACDNSLQVVGLEALQTCKGVLDKTIVVGPYHIIMKYPIFGIFFIHPGKYTFTFLLIWQARKVHRVFMVPLTWKVLEHVCFPLAF